MPSGPFHYREAERCLEIAQENARPNNGLSDAEATLIVGIALQRAQVHATLALAAATADPFGDVRWIEAVR